MGSWTNMAYMGVTYMYYWILSIMVIVLASEIGSIFRSPALAKMLEQHKNNFIKLLGISEDSKREDLIQVLQKEKKQIRELQIGVFSQLGAGKPGFGNDTEAAHLSVLHEEFSPPAKGSSPDLKGATNGQTTDEQPDLFQAEMEIPQEEFDPSQMKEPSIQNEVNEEQEFHPSDSHRLNEEGPNPTKGIIQESKYRYEIEESDDVYIRVIEEDTRNKLSKKEFKLRLADLKTVPGFSAANTNYEPLKLTAEDVMELDDHEWKHIAFFVEEFSLTSNRLFLYCHFTSLCRFQLVSAVLSRLQGNSQVQLILGIIIDSLFLVFTYKSFSRVSTTDLVYEVTTQALVIIYLLMKLLSTTELLSEETKQNKLGMYMVGVIGLICFCTVVNILYGLLKTAFEIIAIVWSKLFKKSSPTAKSSTSSM